MIDITNIKFPRELKKFIEKEDNKYYGGIKRKYTGENYVKGHTIPVAQKTQSFFIDEVKNLAYCVGRGHDILELLVKDEDLVERKYFLEEIEKYGEQGIIVSQGLQLVDFKKFMPEYLLRNGVYLRDLKGNKYERRNLMLFNYGQKMAALKGKYELKEGGNYFENNYELANLIARTTKIVDQIENLDGGRIFNEEHLIQKYFQKERKVSLDEYLETMFKEYRYLKVRNSLRFWKSSLELKKKIFESEPAYTFFQDRESFDELIESTLEETRKIILKDGNSSEKGVFYWMESETEHVFTS